MATTQPGLTYTLAPLELSTPTPVDMEFFQKRSTIVTFAVKQLCLKLHLKPETNLYRLYREATWPTSHQLPSPWSGHAARDVSRHTVDADGYYMTTETNSNKDRIDHSVKNIEFCLLIDLSQRHLSKMQTSRTRGKGRLLNAELPVNTLVTQITVTPHVQQNRRAEFSLFNRLSSTATNHLENSARLLITNISAKATAI